ncbi:MAG: VOC family protein [Candidatus Poribacteria bacterium]|nr:VOC family protein [Candidatus Poribacteria bacterium]
MLSVKQLGHVGLYCTDVQRSKDFFTHILGLTVTDEDPDGRIIFLSAQPEEEHHEVALCPGRDVPPGAKVVQQISFILEDLATLKQFHRHLKGHDVRIRSVVSHGIAFAIYFYDPDDNVIEVYAKTPYKVPQPHSEDIDLELTERELLSIAEASRPS